MLESQPPVNSATNVPLVSTDLPILDLAYKWDHMLCGLSCLDFLPSCNIFKAHPRDSRSQGFLPFHGLIIFS